MIWSLDEANYFRIFRLLLLIVKGYCSISFTDVVYGQDRHPTILDLNRNESNLLWTHIQDHHFAGLENRVKGIIEDPFGIDPPVRMRRVITQVSATSKITHSDLNGRNLMF